MESLVELPKEKAPPASLSLLDLDLRCPAGKKSKTLAVGSGGIDTAN